LLILDANCPNMILGIGSVKTKDEATIFVNNGAEFVVSPLISGCILF
jgi:2-keto-3-deoxy-6-phosphogluconate aldolase